jgi:hypothetical protein
MRKKTVARIGIFLALAIIVMGAKCPKIPDTHEINITLVTEESIEITFEARGSMNVDSNVAFINIDELRQDLEDAEIRTDLITAIRVSKVEYGVVAYNEEGTDRQIVGAEVTLKRPDEGTSAVLVSGLDAEVYPKLGKLVPVPTQPGGIAYINDLLADVLDAIQSGGTSGLAVYGTSSGTSEPTDRASNFDWRIRIYYQIAGGMPTDVPDF